MILRRGHKKNHSAIIVSGGFCNIVEEFALIQGDYLNMSSSTKYIITRDILKCIKLDKINKQIMI